MPVPRFIAWLFTAALVGLSLAPGAAQAAVVLQTDSGGKLTGATGVEVGGLSYDVAFVDGTCLGLFGNCSQFVFNTAAAAGAASQALLDQVLVGAFDDDATLTSGCSGPGLAFCGVWTAYGTNTGSVLVSGATNFNAGGSDSVSQSGWATGNDLSTNRSSVYAVWSRTAEAALPEPSSLALLAAAGVAALWARRRPRPRAAVGV